MGVDEATFPLFVCAYVPEFPAQALLRLRPELARSPVVVLAGDPPLQQVCSTNARAAGLGVVPGMTLAELDSFTGLALLRRSEAEERSARAALLEALAAFTPRLEVQPLAPSSANMPTVFMVVLDMAGTGRLFGTGLEAIARLSRALAALRVFTQFAASANLHTAVCLAPSARKTPCLVPPGQERQRLGPLPLSALHPTARQEEALALWGLRTLGELADLPEEQLIVRLGQGGKRLRLLARGEYPHLLVPEEPAFTLEEFLAFDEPVELLDSLLFLLGPMLDQLLERAGQRALALASVTVTLGLDGGGEHRRMLKPALPVAQREVLLKLLHLDLQAHPPSAGVLSLRVGAEPGDQSKVQLGLFAPQLPEALRLDVTLARIASLVGEDRVGSPRLTDTHASDSFTMERFVVPQAPPPARAARTSVKTTLRRCRPPVEVSVQHEGGRLFAFSLRGKRYAVQQAYGPWRRSGEWWSANIWSREEWDVHAVREADGALNCVLTHDLLRHHWQLEALYD